MGLFHYQIIPAIHSNPTTITLRISFPSLWKSHPVLPCYSMVWRETFPSGVPRKKSISAITSAQLTLVRLIELPILVGRTRHFL